MLPTTPVGHVRNVDGKSPVAICALAQAVRSNRTPHVSPQAPAYVTGVLPSPAGVVRIIVPDAEHTQTAAVCRTPDPAVMLRTLARASGPSRQKKKRGRQDIDRDDGAVACVGGVGGVGVGGEATATAATATATAKPPVPSRRDRRKGEEMDKAVSGAKDSDFSFALSLFMGL